MIKITIDGKKRSPAQQISCLLFKLSEDQRQIKKSLKQSQRWFSRAPEQNQKTYQRQIWDKGHLLEINRRIIRQIHLLRGECEVSTN